VAITKNGLSSWYVVPPTVTLRLRRGAVDLVGEHDLREERALAELEVAALGRLDDDRGAGDVGRHQVGRELDAPELELQRLRQAADEERLAEARHALEQAVAAGEEAGEHAVDDVLVADDRLLDLLLHAVVVGAEGGDEGFGLVGVGHREGPPVRRAS
jgi:hypothetical protein